MTKKELQASLDLNVNALSINSLSLSKEWLLEVITAKIYRTAVVLKNVRESDKGGIMALLGQAVANGIIDGGKAFELAQSKDKDALQKIKDLLPKSEKSDEPNQQDIDQAIAKVLQGGGQNDF